MEVRTRHVLQSCRFEGSRSKHLHLTFGLFRIGEVFVSCGEIRHVAYLNPTRGASSCTQCSAKCGVELQVHSDRMAATGGGCHPSQEGVRQPGVVVGVVVVVGR